MKPVRSLQLTVVLSVAALSIAGCAGDAPEAAGDGAIQVTSTDDACMLSTATAPGGTVTFNVKNEGNQVTEFYLLAEDGLRVIGEVENIDPGMTGDLIVVAPEGNYVTACKPGMVGDGIRADMVLTAAPDGQAVSTDRAEKQRQAVTLYAAYVKDQTEQLLAGTKDFAKAFTDGDTAAAKELYPSVRMHWERIEPVAESFGDLDPILDAREADLEKGQEWTGWHRAEKDLWPPASGYAAMSDAERAALGAKMVADTEELHDRTGKLTYTPDKLANGAKELLDEVATGKVTGEEEIWSHTDLWDFQANVEGARIAYEVLKPLLTDSDTELDGSLQQKFDALQKVLDRHKAGEGFVFYDQLSQEQVRELSAAVDALAEPLSKLTAAVVK